MAPPLPPPANARRLILPFRHSVAVSRPRCIGRNTYCGGAIAPKLRPSRGILYALGAIASVQIGGTGARHLFVFLGPAGTGFLRVAFGAGILLAVGGPAR